MKIFLKILLVVGVVVGLCALGLYIFGLTKNLSFVEVFKTFVNAIKK